MTRMEAFWIGVVLGGLAGMALTSPAKADEVEKWGGINTVSRHFEDSDRYNEENWGVFYECRWDNGTRGVQVGYYVNSFADRETPDRIGDTFYAVGIYQPWRWNDLRLGGFAGLASGYEKGRLVVIGGAMATWELRQDVAVQVIGNPAVVGLQLKLRF